jgi:uncharacterized protein YaeQ
MALKAIIYKAAVSFADLDANVYADHTLTLARHPSETEARMMVRLLAWVLNAPPTNDEGELIFAKDMWEPDEPALLRDDLTGLRQHEIELGQPEERRLTRACGRSRKVTVYALGGTTDAWWAGVAGKLSRVRNLEVWKLLPEPVEQLGALAVRALELQITVQDGIITVDSDGKSVELSLHRLHGGE